MNIAICITGKVDEAQIASWSSFMDTVKSLGTPTFFLACDKPTLMREYLDGKTVDVEYSGNDVLDSSRIGEELRLYEYDHKFHFELCFKIAIRTYTFIDEWFVPPTRPDEVFTVSLDTDDVKTVYSRTFRQVGFDFFYANGMTFKILMGMHHYDLGNYLEEFGNIYMCESTMPETFHFYIFIKRLGRYNREIKNIQY